MSKNENNLEPVWPKSFKNIKDKVKLIKIDGFRKIDDYGAQGSDYAGEKRRVVTPAYRDSDGVVPRMIAIVQFIVISIKRFVFGGMPFAVIVRKQLSLEPDFDSKVSERACP